MIIVGILFQGLWNPRSQTIDAILQLQNKTSEFSEKGTITTRLLVPSSKVGCILGQGGHVINEMRRRTQADIRVYSKDDKPKCASEDEELVQVTRRNNAFTLIFPYSAAASICLSFIWLCNYLN